MNKKLMYTLMILCVIAIAGLGYAGLQQKARVDNLKNKLEDTPPKQHQVKQVSLKREEIEEYQKLVEQKIDAFKKGEYTDDDIFDEGTAGNVLYSLFTPSGVKGLTEDSSKADFEKRYKDFDYKLDHVTAQKNRDGEVRLNAKIDIKYKGEEVKNSYNLVSFEIGNDSRLKGGTLYAEQGKR